MLFSLSSPVQSCKANSGFQFSVVKQLQKIFLDISKYLECLNTQSSKDTSQILDTDWDISGVTGRGIIGDWLSQCEPEMVGGGGGGWYVILSRL